MKKFLFVVACMVCFKGIAQPQLFPKDSRVCFVGNSITNNGEFYHNLNLYYVTRFPKMPVTFFNCGISGDVTSGILKRLEKDVFIHNPTHAVIMIGMNDVNRSLYGLEPTTNFDTLNRRAVALAVYKKNLDSIVRILLSKDIQVILQKPTIFDQNAILLAENHYGVNDALKQCADFAEELALTYQLKTVDYWSILQQINTTLQQKDASSTIIGQDRVHPGPTGHLIMTYQFLKTMQMPSDVSNIKLDVRKIKDDFPKELIENVDYEYIIKNDSLLRFEVTEPSLPFPVVFTQQQALELVPFYDDFNNENFLIKNLKKGDYSLYIDAVFIGIFTHKQLEKGINLALFPQTPQNKQALEVRDALSKLWKAEADLRTIQYVELKFLEGFPNPQNLIAVKAYLDDLVIKKLSATPYYKIQFDKYVLVKPMQKELEATFENQQIRAYKFAQPIPHLFNLVLKK